MEELKNPKILFYDSTIAQITLYNFEPLQGLSSDGLYYTRLQSQRLRSITGTYLKLEPIEYLMETNQGTKWTAYPVTRTTKLPNALVAIRFKIAGVYYSMEKLLKNSILKGFSRVIDDNNYFSAIPLINELNHCDNGVIISYLHKLWEEYTEKRVNVTQYNADGTPHETLNLIGNWSDFSIRLLANHDGIPRLKMVGEMGHVHL